MTAAADQERLDRIHDLPCIACAMMCVRQEQRTEAHHIVDKGYRDLSGGHQATLPLCSWHHRGQCLDGFTQSTMRARFGPSFGLEKKTFVGQFGSERELLALVDADLNPS